MSEITTTKETDRVALSAAIEKYLRDGDTEGPGNAEPGRWVKASELCARFGINQRDLRATGDNPGLVSEFAISGNEGFRHIERASTEEVERFYHRIVEHSQTELFRAVSLRRRFERAHINRKEVRQWLN